MTRASLPLYLSAFSGTYLTLTTFLLTTTRARPLTTNTISTTMFQPVVVESLPRLRIDVPEDTTSIAKPRDDELSAFDHWKCQLFGKFSLRWWKVDTLAHALSAMQRPPDFLAIRCPSRCDHRCGSVEI
ncbi:unnamed protein product [Amoebophrya sp. A25]|nr:unnamed protein product [Amoebophrya sp. A25]|eukprot:GSA25T00022800001.1